MKHGKKYNQGAQLVDRAALYEPNEALDIAVKTATAKFDETVEVHIRLGVDSRHADQQVRGAVVLPNGTGKNVRVAVFAKAQTPRPQPPQAQRLSVQRILLQESRARAHGFRCRYRSPEHDGSRRPSR